jgi:hypothetical protein
MPIYDNGYGYPVPKGKLKYYTNLAGEPIRQNVCQVTAKNPVIKAIEEEMDAKVEAAVSTNPKDYVDPNHGEKQGKVADQAKHITHFVKKQEVFVD